MTPADHESALRLANLIVQSMWSGLWADSQHIQLANAVRDLHAENKRLRELLAAVHAENQFQIDDINAALAGSPTDGPKVCVVGSHIEVDTAQLVNDSLAQPGETPTAS